MIDEVIQELGEASTIHGNRLLAHAIGLTEAVIYSALVSKFLYYRKNNMLVSEWFYVTIDDLQKSTSIGVKPQRTALKQLKKIGLIESKVIGTPPKRHFKLCDCIERLKELLHIGHNIENSIGNIEPEAMQNNDKTIDNSKKNYEQIFPNCEQKEKQEKTDIKKAYFPTFDPNGQMKKTQTDKSKRPKRTNLIYNHKERNRNFINHLHQSQSDKISNDDDDIITASEIEQAEQQARKQIGENANKPEYAELIDVMAHVYTCKQKSIKVQGRRIETVAVKERFHQLEERHLQYVLKCIEYSDPHDRTAYFITCLYNAPKTIDHYKPPKKRKKRGSNDVIREQETAEIGKYLDLVN